jgi:hypothetical protein
MSHKTLKAMKNLDGLMSEDRENTIAMLTILYLSKVKTAKMYLHTFAIFVILSLVILLTCDDVKDDKLFYAVFSMFSVIGCYINYKAQQSARELKELIETYTIK